MPASGPDTPHGPPPVPLTLDREGHWWHEGRPIEHPGLVRLLNRHLVILDDGSVEVRVAGREVVERALVTVEELPYYVIAVTKLQPLTVRLNDESVEAVDPADLWLVGDDRLFVRVKGGRHPARFLRTPWLTLAAHFEEAAGGGWALCLSDAVTPVRVEPSPPVWPGARPSPGDAGPGAEGPRTPA